MVAELPTQSFKRLSVALCVVAHPHQGDMSALWERRCEVRILISLKSHDNDTTTSRESTHCAVHVQPIHLKVELQQEQVVIKKQATMGDLLERIPDRELSPALRAFQT